MITIVASKSNKGTDSSCRHAIEDYSTSPLKRKTITKLYAQTKPILELVSTSNAKKSTRTRFKNKVTSNSTIKIKWGHMDFSSTLNMTTSAILS
jgi:arsenate reductase-like glutaredoxin family protein